jgi:hypothetical protein
LDYQEEVKEAQQVERVKTQQQPQNRSGNRKKWGKKDPTPVIIRMLQLGITPDGRNSSIPSSVLKIDEVKIQVEDQQDIKIEEPKRTSIVEESQDSKKKKKNENCACCTIF